MKLKVPFARNLNKWKGSGWCGPLALASILRYYGYQDKIEEIVKKAGYLKGKGTTPQGLINYCLNKGMQVDYFSLKEIQTHENKQFSEKLQQFYKRVNSEKRDKIFLKKNKKFKGYNYIEKNSSVKDIEAILNKQRPILILHNLVEVYNKAELWMHYVAIVGFDKNNFYVHNVFPKNRRFEKVKKSLLMKSLSSNGLSKSLIVPYKKCASQ